MTKEEAIEISTINHDGSVYCNLAMFENATLYLTIITIYQIPDWR